MLDSAIRTARPSPVMAAMPALTSGMIAGERPSKRLVEQEHLRVERQRARDREHLALPAAHLRALARRVAAEHGEDAVGQVDPLGRGAAAGARPCRDLDVLADGEIRENAGVFRRPAEPEPGDLVGARPWMGRPWNSIVPALGRR